MSKRTIPSSKVVLRAKFLAAHALASFYEKRIHELRTCVQTAFVDREQPRNLRERILKAIETILSKSFAGSLLINDHARCVKKLGKGYQRRLVDSYAHWQRHNRAILALDQNPTTPESEWLALAEFGSSTCEMLVVGILPVRRLRDQYAEQLYSKSAKRQQQPRGRPADLGKPDRDRRIYLEYESTEGRPGERRDKIAHSYGIGPEAIRKIVREQRHLHAKVGCNSSL